MTLPDGLLDVAAFVLIAAGAAKLVEPGYTTVALGTMGLPNRSALVRAGAVVEAALGALALTLRSTIPAALVAVSYVAFSAFVLAARRRGIPITSCGCLGSMDAPPTRGHVAITAVGAAGCAWAAAEAPEPLFDAFERRPGAALAFSIAVAVGAGAALRILAARPLVRARR